MKISTRVRYGTRAMAALAVAYPEKAVSVKLIAQKQRLSAKYLEQIMAALKGAGLIKVVRGGRGGYMLSRDPATITLMEVYHALEGALCLVDCLDHSGSCEMTDACPTKDTWREMTEALQEILRRTTIQDLEERQRQKNSAEESTYYEESMYYI